MNINQPQSSAASELIKGAGGYVMLFFLKVKPNADILSVTLE